MRNLTHLSLFSGIGGLDLAAEWAGIETIGQCEWAEYPTKVLEKRWPDVPRWKDIRTLTGESFYERTGRRTVDIISGGFPCQPFSVAGKQRGKEDDRYLWPEMVRVIKELRPTWVIGENVAGIVRMALADILSELEACGYRTRTFLVPACAVGARHRRYRVAIVGYSEHNGLSSAAVAGGVETTGRGEQERKETAGESPGAGESRDSKVVGRTQNLENPGCIGFSKQGDVCEQPGGAESERTSEAMANTDPERELQPTGSQQDVGDGTGISCKTLADAESQLEGRLPIREKAEQPGFIGGCEDVQHAHGAGRKEQHTATEPDQQGFPGRGCNARDVCDATGEGLPDRRGEPLGRQGTSEQKLERPDSHVSDADNGRRDVRRDREFPTAEEIERAGRNIGGRTQEHEPGERRPAEPLLGGMVDGLPTGMDGDLDFVINHYWDDEPEIPRIATGIEHRVDRLKCLGNAVVPQQFYPIFRVIAEISQEKNFGTELELTWNQHEYLRG